MVVMQQHSPDGDNFSICGYDYAQNIFGALWRTNNATGLDDVLVDQDNDVAVLQDLLANNDCDGTATNNALCDNDFNPLNHISTISQINDLQVMGLLLFPRTTKQHSSKHRFAKFM